MTDVAHAAPAAAPFLLCRACGTWSQGSACPACGWPALSPGPRGEAGPPPLRLLVDLTLDHRGRLRVSRIHSHRLAWLARQTSWLDLDREANGSAGADLAFCRARVRSAVKGLDPSRLDADLWERLRGALCAEALARVAERSPGWRGRGGGGSEPPQVDLALRIALHVPELELPEAPSPAVRVTSFVRAMDTEGAKLQFAEIEPGLGALVLSPDPRRARAEIALRVGRDALLQKVRLALSPPEAEKTDGLATVAELEQFHFCPAGATQTIGLPLPSAQELRRISKGVALGGATKILLEFRGAGAPFAIRVPTAALDTLPGPEAQVDVLLDLGSTQTKFELRLLATGEFRRNWLETPNATARFMLPPFRKQALIAQPAALSAWLADALPALAAYVHAKHGAFLRDVHLGFPAVEPQAAPAAVAPGLDRWLLGQVHVHAEHALLARRYLPVVAALRDAAAGYRVRLARNAKARKAAEERNQQIEARCAAYDKRFWLGKWWQRFRDEDPHQVRRESLPDRLRPLEEWMRRLLEHPARLDRYVLLDAGGYSLDVSVIDQGALLPVVSRSWPDVGGETLSGRLGMLGPDPDMEKSREATNQKAIRGNQYDKDKVHSLEDYRVQAYRDATLALYAPPLEAVFEACARAWQQDPFLVVLAGGGSLNPFLGEAIDTAMQARGLSGERVSPAQLAGYIAVGAAMGLALEGGPAVRFLETLGWADDILQPGRNYDPFALVAAMTAEEA